LDAFAILLVTVHKDLAVTVGVSVVVGAPAYARNNVLEDPAVAPTLVIVDFKDSRVLEQSALQRDRGHGGQIRGGGKAADAAPPNP
jgi:hypothetical protein